MSMIQITNLRKTVVEEDIAEEVVDFVDGVEAVVVVDIEVDIVAEEVVVAIIRIIECLLKGKLQYLRVNM